MGTLRNYPFAIKHNEFGGCKKDILYISKDYKEGEVLFAKDVIYLNGVKPTDGEMVKCGSCGLGVVNMIAADIYKRT